MKRISVIGSTGSIGTQVLNIVRNHPDKFSVVGLVSHSNIQLLRSQIEEFKPMLAGVTGTDDMAILKEIMPSNSELICGEKALIAASGLEAADTVIISVVGVSGIRAVENAINHGKEIALANKEALVVGGDIIMSLARKKGIEIKPIDSEHSAVYQCLRSGRRKDLKRIILTCSGGAFRDLSYVELKTAKAIDALRHPTWNMGKKITIDCATLMNKGLEIIEARYLFDFCNIDYILHKESIIHSMVEFTDNTVIANMSYPSMELPIQYALSCPERFTAKTPALDFAGISKLSFSEVDTVRFPCILLAKQAMSMGTGATAVLNAANEIAVDLYLRDLIAFTDIYALISDALSAVKYSKPVNVEDLLYIDCITREYTFKVYNNKF